VQGSGINKRYIHKETSSNEQTLQEKTFFATKKVVAKCIKLLQKCFTPTTKKSLLVVAISSVAISFAAKFNIVVVSNYANDIFCWDKLIFSTKIVVISSLS
jgi:hypothetical protein